MTFDLEKVLESKRKFRRELAAKPIVEKLRMLDAMRERQVAIRSARDARPREDDRADDEQSRD
ncbi:MAG TPA: hypothetical protein VMU84_01070 [Thermoanaerobaculia bacterium]|nr:hypothetical protein [Thermoanaerobaculia bacterium]